MQSDTPEGPAAVADTKKLSEFNHQTSRSQSANIEGNDLHLGPDYETEPGVQEALAALDSGAQAVFILGRAGTGKTTLIQHIMKSRDATRQVVLAPTGIAALNVGGQTIHSFFYLPPRLLDEQALKDKRPKRLWKTINRIIIDEVSMVRVDVLDAIDFRLRQARQDERPFGGVQMILVGDFLQLPPVVPRAESEMLARLGYGSPYAFSARSIAELDAAFIHLPTVRRQLDPKFIALLGSLRDGQNLEAAIAELNEKCCRAHRSDATPMLLTGSNARADHYNQAGLKAIDAPEISYQAKLTGTFDKQRNRLPAAELLTLKPGARVMALKNDSKPGARRWVNGSVGTVEQLTSDRAWVRFDHTGAVDEVERQTWESIRYNWNEKTKSVETEVIGRFVQIPLSLAWAATIHKAQGLSLDDVRIDLEGGAFASGQAYVAVSRVRSLEGLSLARPLRPSDFFVDQMLLDFEQWSQ